MNTSPVVMLAGGIGALLIYSSIRGYNPVDVLKSGLGGDPPESMGGKDKKAVPPRPPPDSSGGGGGGGGGGSFASNVMSNGNRAYV